jgi:hypothetical protein
VTTGHFTLRPGFNVVLIIVWGLAAGVLSWAAQPHPVLLAGVGAAAGLIAGLLQRRSIQSAPATFAGARSALDVRRAFMSNRSGKLSIAMIWIAGLVLMVIALVKGGNVPLGFAAGYATFMFVREIFAFRAVAKEA